MDWDFNEGEILLIDKPLDWTSFQVVNKVRWTISRKLGVKRIKVGHAGTLDPLATGLLMLCTGKKTKTIADLQGLDKTYCGQLKLGATTPCYDSELPEDASFPTEHINDVLLHQTTKQFVGEIAQLPPIFSAIKVGGQKGYKAARNGQAIDIKPRDIEIHRFEITKIAMPFVDFEVHCSKGTYIRSLAYDFGKAMSSGAYLTNLQRTSVGSYSLKDSWQLPDLIAAIENA